MHRKVQILVLLHQLSFIEIQHIIWKKVDFVYICYMGCFVKISLISHEVSPAESLLKTFFCCEVTIDLYDGVPLGFFFHGIQPEVFGVLPGIFPEIASYDYLWSSWKNSYWIYQCYKTKMSILFQLSPEKFQIHQAETSFCISLDWDSQLKKKAYIPLPTIMVCALWHLLCCQKDGNQLYLLLKYDKIQFCTRQNCFINNFSFF